MQNINATCEWIIHKTRERQGYISSFIFLFLVSFLYSFCLSAHEYVIFLPPCCPWVKRGAGTLVVGLWLYGKVFFHSDWVSPHAIMLEILDLLLGSSCTKSENFPFCSVYLLMLLTYQMYFAELMVKFMFFASLLLQIFHFNPKEPIHQYEANDPIYTRRDILCNMS